MVGYRFQMNAAATPRVSSRPEAMVDLARSPHYCPAQRRDRGGWWIASRRLPHAGDSCSMPTRVIDIHPHIIAADTKRYPLAPLGGHQSEWSRTRPVTTEQMLTAMDVAGVGKSAIVQASTCYGHDNSYVPDAVRA